MKIKLNSILFFFRKRLLITIFNSFVFLCFTGVYASSTSIITTEKTSKNTIQQLQISGLVYDSNGIPLAGAKILEKGTTNGVQTDFDGNFSIKVSTPNATLVVSYLGFTSKEVIVNNQTNLKITLTEDVSALDEVVVVGYGTQKKVNLTGSVASIDQKFLANRPITNSSQALQGLSGVYVNMSRGRPGADGANIRIRGVGSFGTNNNPLVLVDGVEYNLRDINPSDIESITVLKDAASSAIYGNRAANGVVLIKTRGGEKGKFKVD